MKSLIKLFFLIGNLKNWSKCVVYGDHVEDIKLWVCNVQSLQYVNPDQFCNQFEIFPHIGYSDALRDWKSLYWSDEGTNPETVLWSVWHKKSHSFTMGS
jgi:hypothetical protein